MLQKLITEASFADRKAARKAALDAKSKVPQGKSLNVAGPKNTKTGVSGGVADSARKRIGGEFEKLRNDITTLTNKINSGTFASDFDKSQTERELEDKKKQLADKEKQLQFYKDTDKTAREKIDAQDAQTRNDIRNIGANLGVIGKIITRFIGDGASGSQQKEITDLKKKISDLTNKIKSGSFKDDIQKSDAESELRKMKKVLDSKLAQAQTVNQKMLNNDANLKKMLENPREFKKFVDNVRSFLKRQMKRRGYDDGQINKLLENYNLELNVHNLLLEANKKNAPLLREYREHIQQLMPYMQKQIGFNKPPTINFLEDEANAQDPLGKTAHYDPSNMEISVYVTGRHPKDIMRSVAHEMIHHAQNCRGDLSPDKVGEAGEGYAQSNGHLRNMEKEAYLLGNMMFRDWEDTHKKGNNIMEKELEEEMCEHDKVHPGKTHAAYKRDDKPLNEWKNQELFGLLMKRFGIIAEKGSKPDFLDLDKDGDKEEPMKKAAKEKKDDSSLEEEKMTKGEKKEKEKIVKGMKKNKKDFEKRYPGRGEQVMYATATKKAMEK